MVETTKRSIEIDAKAEMSQELNLCLRKMCMNPDFSDVTFVVGQCKLPALKMFLAARSPYFHAMFYGEMAESKQSEIELNVPLHPFKAILGYIYTGSISFDNVKLGGIFETLDLANQYGFEALTAIISEHLTTIVSLDNCCDILNVAQLYSLKFLNDTCTKIVDQNATKLLTHDAFKTLTPDSLRLLLKRDSFYAPEIEIFNAVVDWYKDWPKADINEITSHVRFSLMSLEQLLDVVRPSSIVDPDRLLDVIREKTFFKSLRYRGVLSPEKNVATAEFGAKTIKGGCPEKLLNGNTTEYDGANGYSYHRITACRDDFILVDLGTMSCINHIKILLWDRDSRTYSYYIEVSLDQSNWERIIDHTKDECRSWQYLHFPSRAVRYIKLVGTVNTANDQFHAVALEVYHTLQKLTTIVKP